MGLFIDDETLHQRVEHFQDPVSATSNDVAVFLTGKSVDVVGEPGDKVDLFSGVEVPNTDCEVVTGGYKAFVFVEFKAADEIVMPDEGTDHVAGFDVP